jgi:hypothetical protein
MRGCRGSITGSLPAQRLDRKSFNRSWGKHWVRGPAAVLRNLSESWLPYQRAKNSSAKMTMIVSSVSRRARSTSGESRLGTVSSVKMKPEITRSNVSAMFVLVEYATRRTPAAPGRSSVCGARPISTTPSSVGSKRMSSMSNSRASSARFICSRPNSAAAARVEDRFFFLHGVPPVSTFCTSTPAL